MRVLMLHGLVLAMACLAALGTALAMPWLWLARRCIDIGDWAQIECLVATAARRIRRRRGGRS